MYKLIGLCALVAVVAGNDLTVGAKDGGNKIYDEKLVASPAIWRQVKNFTINATEGDIISRVIITDLRPEKDGEANVVEGGEGHNNVTIELKSPAVFRGFEFNVEVYVARDNQHADPVEQPKSLDAPKVPKDESKLPIGVAGEASDDNLRKTRKTDEQDKDSVTPKVSVSESTTLRHLAPAPSTTHAHKENDGETINNPVSLGKDVKTVTPTSEEPVEKKGESDVVDPVAVNNQPTHLNDTDSSVSDKTAKVPTHPEVSNGGVKNTQLRNVRRTEEYTTEADVTISTTTGIESTTGVDTTSSEGSVDLTHAPVVPYDWNVKVPIDDTIKPIGNFQGLNPPKTIGSDNAAVQSHTSMAPLPYIHY